ncbi:hypothetical protein KC19_VG306900 [Ceratodon purpureus]|uniref:Uncharacterized protein n=1 Tax=Ceratodon purpureus TaxID=3225 RepID=A0A8T0HWA1_CERPU|nr:hypothetical protein KC19_VG306900 [Ceratodon purpureus]
MRRDKGSAGRKQKTAAAPKPGAIETRSSASRELVGVEQHAGQKPSEDPPTPEQRLTKEDVLQHPFVQSLWNESQMLKGKEAQGTDSNAPSQPIQEGGESNSTMEKAKVDELIHKNANGDAGDPSKSGTDIPCVAEDLTRKTRSKTTSKKSTPTVDKQQLRK